MAKVASSLAIKSGSPAETRRLGARLGRLLRPGDLVLLSGGLGGTAPVTSKPFVLLGEYEGRLHLYHADLYRLEEPAQAEELALTEYSAAGALVVEWAERAWEVSPPEHLLVRLEIAGVSQREFTLEARGERYQELVDALAKGRRRP